MFRWNVTKLRIAVGCVKKVILIVSVHIYCRVASLPIIPWPTNVQVVWWSFCGLRRSEGGSLSLHIAKVVFHQPSAICDAHWTVLGLWRHVYKIGEQTSLPSWTWWWMLDGESMQLVADLPWYWSVFWVCFSALTLSVGWEEDYPTYHKTRVTDSETSSAEVGKNPEDNQLTRVYPKNSR